MRLIEIAIGIALRIPDSWDCFVHHGWLYVKDAHGHFVIQRPALVSIDPTPQ